MFRLTRLLRNLWSRKEANADIGSHSECANASAIQQALHHARSEVHIDGWVTNQYEGYWLINGSIYCDSNRILGGDILQVGDRVHVHATRNACSSGFVAVRVDRVRVWNDIGDGSGDISSSSEHDCVRLGCIRPGSTSEKQMHVTDVDLTGLVHLGNGIQCPLSRCRTGYRPCVGDSVAVTTALSCTGWPVVVTIAPLLEIPFEGSVTSIGTRSSDAFVVDGYVACSSSDCQNSYVPQLGDVVRGIAVENDWRQCTRRGTSVEFEQRQCTHRALSLDSVQTQVSAHRSCGDVEANRCSYGQEQAPGAAALTGMSSTAAKVVHATSANGSHRTAGEQCGNHQPAVLNAPTVLNDLPSSICILGVSKPSCVRKNGIELSGNFDVGIVQSGQSRTCYVWIRNISSGRQLYCGASAENSVHTESLTIDDPVLVLDDAQRLNSSALIPVSGVCTKQAQLRLLPASVAFIKIHIMFGDSGLLKCPIKFAFGDHEITCQLTASVTSDALEAESTAVVPRSQTSRALLDEARQRYRHDHVSSRKPAAFPAAAASLRRTQRQSIAVRISSALPQYDVPRELVLCMTGESKRELEDIAPELQQDLSSRTHQTIMATLLYLEEIQSQIELRKYDMHKVQFDPRGDMLSLLVPGLADGMPALAVGDTMSVCLTSDPLMSFDGSIQQIINENILVKFYDQFHARYGGEDCDVIFRLSRSVFRRCHHAIRFLRKMSAPFLFPSGIRPQKPLGITGNRVVNGGKELERYFCAILNTEQKVAVARVVAAQCRPFPYIIFGPPGTGKTVTMVEAILQVFSYVQGSRILVCAPSNSAADLLAEMLLLQRPWKPVELVRLNSMRRVEEDVRDIVRPYCKIGSEVDSAAHHRVIVCTCATSGLFYGLSLSTRHFTHVFVDEAGQASEPECLVPLGLVAANPDASLVLAGDPRQLGAVVKSAAARHYGLEISYLERIMNHYLSGAPSYSSSTESSTVYDSFLVSMLTRNYRAHPVLLKITSELFYDDNLISEVASASKNDFELSGTLAGILPRHDCPLVFHGVRGQEIREGTDPSWFNPAEIVHVCNYLKAVLANVQKSDIGVITPYRKQREKIRSMIASLGLGEIKVGSVEEFQGQERSAIIVSTVRSCETYSKQDLSSRLDFIYCPKRFNVAISRAKSLLIVIGNPHTLMQDPKWQAFIKCCVVTGCYTGCSPPDDASDTAERKTAATS